MLEIWTIHWVHKQSMMFYESPGVVTITYEAEAECCTNWAWQQRTIQNIFF